MLLLFLVILLKDDFESNQLITLQESLRPDEYEFSFPDILMRPYRITIPHRQLVNCSYMFIYNYSYMLCVNFFVNVLSIR